MGAFATGMKEKSDILVAVSVVFVILIMIVPLNAFFMDIFLTLSISLSILILFIGMYIHKPLDFSVFPSVLLIVTLFRLSLNIATTRLVLVHGDEGTDELNVGVSPLPHRGGHGLHEGLAAVGIDRVVA